VESVFDSHIGVKCILLGTVPNKLVKVMRLTEHLRKVDVVNYSLTSAYSFVSNKHVEGGCLTCAVDPQQCKNFTTLHLERDTFYSIGSFLGQLSFLLLFTVGVLRDTHRALIYSVVRVRVWLVVDFN
jgi:hypothetical protein